MKNAISALIFAVSLLFYTGLEAEDRDNKPIQVMIIGSEHFANPGQDVINKEVESVLTETKQNELSSIANGLMRFKPTVVAVEALSKEINFIDLDYLNFTPATLLKEPNESVQIGYRLANLAGLKNVYAIDEQPSDGEPDYFPFDKFMKHLETTKQAEKFNKDFIQIKRELDDFFSTHKNKTLGSYLAELNSPGSPVISLSFYLSMLNYDKGEKQPGAEVFGYYMMRNTKIASKLLDVVKPGDRVVVVYGAGHKAWLDFIFGNMNGIELIDPVPYLRLQ